MLSLGDIAQIRTFSRFEKNGGKFNFAQCKNKRYQNVKKKQQKTFIVCLSCLCSNNICIKNTCSLRERFSEMDD